MQQYNKTATLVLSSIPSLLRSVTLIQIEAEGNKIGLCLPDSVQNERPLVVFKSHRIQSSFCCDSPRSVVAVPTSSGSHPATGTFGTDPDQGLNASIIDEFHKA
jgi:hypothetical protein